jgi:hypothetical protein
LAYRKAKKPGFFDYLLKARSFTQGVETMNWKKALLVLVLAGFALVFFVVAAVGLAATAAVTTAAVAISESGVVQAFEDVADGAERIQIDVDGNSVTFTNPDSGESRVVVAEEHLGRGRLHFNLPEITVTDAESGEKVVIGPGPRGQVDVTVPSVTITDPDSGQSRVLIAAGAYILLRNRRQAQTKLDADVDKTNS